MKRNTTKFLHLSVFYKSVVSEFLLIFGSKPYIQNNLFVDGMDLVKKDGK